jgi:hypothetical protein
MPYKPRDVESALTSKFGFSIDKKRRHRWFKLELPELPVISTMVSHGREEIGRKLESKIARELKVRTSFFRKMMDCTKEREDYYQQVRTDPFLPFNIFNLTAESTLRLFFISASSVRSPVKKM